MKFEFNQLGPLYHGQIDLADLTVICGENNTGKTYITYALYGLFRSWRGLSEFEPAREETGTLEETGLLKIDLQNKLEKTKGKLKKQLELNFQKHLPELLAAKSNATMDTNIKLDFEIGNSWQEKQFSDETRSEKGKLLLSIHKPAGSSIVEITAAKKENESIPTFALSQWIESALLNIVLSDIFPSTVFLASTERTGAVIFKEKDKNAGLKKLKSPVLVQRPLHFNLKKLAIQEKRLIHLMQKFTKHVMLLFFVRSIMNILS